MQILISTLRLIQKENRLGTERQRTYNVTLWPPFNSLKQKIDLAIEQQI
jgi:hypothetical protein